MNSRTVSTRRGFCRKAGAAMSAPLALAATGAAEANAHRGRGLEARVARLEDENAVRGLLGAYVRLAGGWKIGRTVLAAG